MLASLRPGLALLGAAVADPEVCGRVALVLMASEQVWLARKQTGNLFLLVIHMWPSEAGEGEVL